MTTIVDDQGAAHPAPKLTAANSPDPDHPATRAMVASISDALYGESIGCGQIVIQMMVVPLVVLASCAGGGVVGAVIQSPGLGILASAVILILLWWAVSRRLTPPQHQALARGLLRVGRCGSCGHSLAGAPANEGFVRCGECGAAWAAAFVWQVHVPDADAFGARRLRRRLEGMRRPTIRHRDARGRTVQIQLPKARWVRRTALAGPARRIRWTVALLTGGGGVACLVVILVLLAGDGPGATAPVLSVLLAYVLLMAAMPLVQVVLLRRAGICAACSSALDEARRCTECDAEWGQASSPPGPPPAPPPPTPSAPPRAPSEGT